MSFFSSRKAAFSLTFLLLCVLAPPNSAQKRNKEKESEEESEVAHSQSTRYSIDGSMNNKDNECSCRVLRRQIDTLETRLDRMIDLWNDFVDRNQDPYPGGPGGNRQPPRQPPPYYISPRRDSELDRPGRMPPLVNRPGRLNDDYDQGQSTGPRRFRF